MDKVAVVTGAGSGVGQAVAIKLAKAGWRVVVVGRRAEALQDTVAKCEAGRVTAIACDVAEPAAVERLGRDVLTTLGPVEVLVNSAGTNVPKRKLAEVSP